nr:VacJ family lipoprotein [Alteromonas sp. 5E99-2]
MVFITALVIGGCTTRHSEQQGDSTADTNVEQNQSDPRDPIEPINRVVWDFNWNILDRYLIRPATIAYTTVMPKFARTGLLNAARNLEEPGNVVNNALQGKGGDSLDSLARFTINSTLGLAGLIDIADKMGLSRQDEDFDEVLGVWGVPNGPFVMTPALGPNDVRGIAGDTVDNFYYPLTILDGSTAIIRTVVVALETRATLILQEDQLLQSPDDYAFVKNAYFQNKAFQVSDGKLEDPDLDEEQLDDFDEFEAFLEEGQQ